MRRTVLLTLIVGAMLCMAASFAQGPTVTSPKNGDRIGPAVDVVGNLGHKGLIVVITDVYRDDTNKKVSSVPGIRHYTENDGKFSFHIATPRNPWGKDVPLTYKIRVFELKGPTSPGPETVVTCHAADR